MRMKVKVEEKVVPMQQRPVICQYLWHIISRVSLSSRQSGGDRASVTELCVSLHVSSHARPHLRVRILNQQYWVTFLLSLPFLFLNYSPHTLSPSTLRYWPPLKEVVPRAFGGDKRTLRMMIDGKLRGELKKKTITFRIIWLGKICCLKNGRRSQPKFFCIGLWI